MFDCVKSISNEDTLVIDPKILSFELDDYYDRNTILTVRLLRKDGCEMPIKFDTGKKIRAKAKSILLELILGKQDLNIVNELTIHNLVDEAVNEADKCIGNEESKEKTTNILEIK